jgi:hypothetical protein
MTDPDITRTPARSCPFCGYTMDAVGPAARDVHARPTPGDLAVCLKCGEILTFDPDLSVRAMNNREWLALTSEERRAATAARNNLQAFNAWCTAHPDEAAALKRETRARVSVKDQGPQ